MIYIDPNWTYRETVEHIRKIKGDYQGILSSFSMWERKEWADFIVSTRDKFYALGFSRWQTENLWNYMNNNFPYAYLYRSAIRRK